MDSTEVQLESNERGSETGLDFFGARYFSGAQGRFSIPDPSRQSVDPANPQTWNRYVYGLNNPLKYVDPNGLWPTAVHDLILNSIFGGVLTPRQVKLLRTVSWEQDNPLGAGQNPANSNWHSQCTPAQHGQCKADIANYINANLNRAKTLGNDFGLVDEALTYFGRAAHTLADAGSPFHVAADGTPTTWNGTFGAGGLSHVIGEQLDAYDWYHFGQSIRNVIGGFYGAFPEQASRLLGDQNAAAHRAIDNFVNAQTGAFRMYLSPVQEGENRDSRENRGKTGTA